MSKIWERYTAHIQTGVRCLILKDLRGYKTESMNDIKGPPKKSFSIKNNSALFGYSFTSMYRSAVQLLTNSETGFASF